MGMPHQYYGFAANLLLQFLSNTSGLEVICRVTGYFSQSVFVGDALIQNFTYSVVPGLVVSSTAIGAGLQTANAGEYASFMIYMSDSYNNTVLDGSFEIVTSIQSIIHLESYNPLLNLDDAGSSNEDEPSGLLMALLSRSQIKKSFEIF